MPLFSKLPKYLKFLVPAVVLFTVIGYWLFSRGDSYTYQYNGGSGGGGGELRVKGEFSEDPVNQDFSVVIPKLGVNAPVKENVEGAAEWAVAPQVLKGVGHYKRGQLGDVTVDGDLPGGEPGNVFLFGHSQILGRDSEENYAGVFDDLEELEDGDIVEVYYQGEKHQYKVKSGQVVGKDDLKWVTHDGDDTETLTLMSCWPLGLDWKRYVVQAEKVS